MSKSFNWQELLKGHPVFAGLDEAATVRLLADEASQEKIYPRDSQIVRAGETGESLFLIGSGSVQVTVFGNPIAVLGKGEFFGEIAVLERRPRSASVSAREQCLLLEIAGETFRQLLASHPDIETKLRATASLRLSQQRQ
jgi:CRP-like cAMP-binding protein